MSQAFERFIALLSASDQVFERASKDEIAEVARVLADGFEVLIAVMQSLATPEGAH